jgi:Reverse transcriptase (RNA-dependent DNA polymerase)
VISRDVELNEEAHCD